MFNAAEMETLEGPLTRFLAGGWRGT